MAHERCCRIGESYLGKSVPSSESTRLCKNKSFEQLVEGRWERERRKNNGNGQGDQRRDGQKEEERRGERRERDGEC